MTDAEALLAAIWDRPNDDTPRLIYADYLDEPERAGSVACEACKGAGKVRDNVPYGERSKCPACDGSGSVSNGTAERAAFIRVQVALARLPPRPSGNCRCDGGGTVCRTCRDERDWDAVVGPLRNRERELWEDRGVGDSFIHPVPVWDVVTHPYPPVVRLEPFPVDDVRVPYVVVARGFPAVAHLSLAVLMGGECPACRGLRGNWHEDGRPQTDPAASCVTCKGEGAVPGLAAQLGAVVGLTGVRVTNAEPDDDANTVTTYSWWDSDPDRNDRPRTAMIGRELFRLLPGEPISDWGEYRKSFPTRDAALDALSAAALAYCRAEAAKSPAVV